MMKKWSEGQEKQDSDKINSEEINSDSIQTKTKVKHIQNIACFLTNEDDFDYTVAAPILLSTKTFEKRYENGS